MNLFDRHILKSMIGPFFFALMIVIFLFLFQFLIKSLDQFVGKGLSIWVIIQLISLNLAWMLTLAVPMAMLVSSMMTFGTMSSNNEITILKASGVSLIRLMIPVVLISILMFYLMLRFNNDVLPEANHQARILLYDITKTKPTFILEPGKFSDDLNGVQILVKKTFPNSNNIEGVYIYNYSNPNSKDLLTAKSGDISFSANFEKVIMNLNNGEIHQYNMVNGKQDYRKINFEKHRLSFDAEGFGFKKSDDNTFSRGDRELSADAMKAVVDSLKVNRENMYEIFVKNINSDLSRVNKINFMDTVYYKDQKDTAVTDDIDITRKRKITSYDTLNNYIKLFTGKFNESKNLKNSYLQLGKQINSYDVEIYKKYSIPFACIVFVLVGAPLGYRVRRGGFGIAAGMSLLFFLLYWACLIGGEKLADRGIVSAFTGMWIADIIIGCLGLYLIFKSS
ncbi:MAG: LptF/LptG family permease [Ignavibacteria bacterium]|jgi:lipopolysaccharide export system permease protein|nr:LptF/LptG family permease [Ignavibacteria bacterium]